MIRIRLEEKLPQGAEVPSVNSLIYFGNNYDLYRAIIEVLVDKHRSDDEGLVFYKEWEPVEIIGIPYAES